jgi:hypothetical protein
MTRTRHEAVGSTRAATGAAAFFLSLIALGSCGTPPGQFFVVQNQVPTSGCGIPAAVTNQYRGSGDLDVRLVFDGAADGYLAYPVMQNNLTPSEEGADLNRIAVTSYDVDVSLGDGASDGMINFFQTLDPDPANSPSPLLHYNTPYSASVSSGGGNTSAIVDAVRADLARAIRSSGALGTAAYAYLTATIRFRGTTDGGRDVVSDPFNYPIRVCDGCLISSLSVCPSTSATINPGNPCNVAQDQSVDCCSSGTTLTCPARTAAQ